MTCTLRVVSDIIRVLTDSLRTLAHSLGLGPQVDVLLEEKFERVRRHYVSPVLDFGAGTCFFSKHMRENGLEVTAVDVVDAGRYPEVALEVFQPPRLPFSDGAFETAAAHFVFHHIEQQEEMFSELLRVTRRTLVISEDVIDSASDVLFASLHTGTSPWSRAWSGFRSTDGWRQFFAAFPVAVTEARTIPRWRTPFYPIRRVVFVLEVTES